jgi:hypothetical protein
VIRAPFRYLPGKRISAVPISPRQDELLHLAGTVRLPSPYPATGTVTVVAFEADRFDPYGTVLQLTHRVGDRLDVSRVFRLSDVRAIDAPWPSEKGGYQGTAAPASRELKLSADVVDFFARRDGDYGSVRLEKAAVYLPEAAPVVLHVDAAQTAAESAEYYPPFVQGGTKPVFFCDNAPKYPPPGEPRTPMYPPQYPTCEGEDLDL